MSVENDDVGADIRAAFDSLSGGAEPVVNVVDPANEEPVELPAEPEEGEQKGPARGADGKFVAKTEETEQVQPQEPVKAQEAPQEPIRVPAGWSPAAKAKFGSLDPEIQKEVLKRERDISVAIEDKAKELKRYEPLDQVLAPHRQKWAVAGVDEATAVKQLLAASDWLERDPAGAIAYLAKQYGLNAQVPHGQAPQPQPQANPQYDQLQQQIARLEQQLTETREAPLRSQVESFFNDPANLYAENVRTEMSALLQSGSAKDLAEAYDMACWMRPDIRALLQTPQVAPVQDPQKAVRAKQASGSVTGAPSTAPIVAANGGGSIEDDIRAAFGELQGRA